jgi:hypothetical protein
LFDASFSEEEETIKMAWKQPKRAVKGKGKVRLVEVEESSSDESAEGEVEEVEEDESEDEEVNDDESELTVAVRALGRGYSALAKAQKKAAKIQREKAAGEGGEVAGRTRRSLAAFHWWRRRWQSTTLTEGSCWLKNVNKKNL